MIRDLRLIPPMSRVASRIDPLWREDSRCINRQIPGAREFSFPKGGKFLSRRPMNCQQLFQQRLKQFQVQRVGPVGLGVRRIVVDL